MHPQVSAALQLLKELCEYAQLPDEQGQGDIFLSSISELDYESAIAALQYLRRIADEHPTVMLDPEAEGNEDLTLTGAAWLELQPNRDGRCRQLRIFDGEDGLTVHYYVGEATDKPKAAIDMTGFDHLL